MIFSGFSISADKARRAKPEANSKPTKPVRRNERRSPRWSNRVCGIRLSKRLLHAISEAMMEPAVELNNVHLSLGSGAARVHIFKGISLTIARGETAGLIGPSGSGKSTLLMVIAGLEQPDSGTVIVDGTSLGKLDEDALARFRGARIGIVFQSFHLIPTMTALENVAIPL